MQDSAWVNYLFLDLNSYFASVEQQEDLSLRGRPVVVVPTLTDKTCAIAASYEAKALGIKTGTIIHEALKLCPGLVIRQARHDAYVDYHHRIMEELERHLPIETVHSIDEAACRLVGCERRPENAVRLAKDIKQGMIENIGPAIRCSIGLSVNAYLAKLATELQKPDGLQILHPEDLPVRIEHMKLTDLPWIGRGVERRLRATGVHDVKTLWSLDAGRMRRVWGNVMGQRFWYMLHGTQVPPIETTKRMVGHSHVLPPALRPGHLAHLVARRLMVKAAARMRRMDYWASEVSICLRFVAGGTFGQRVPVPSTQDTFTLVRGVDELWRMMERAFGAQHIKQVSVTLSDLSEQQSTHHDLFESMRNRSEDIHLRRISLSRALDGLNRRYGRDTVSLGIQPPEQAQYMGAKIAFTRIPDRQEFYE